VNIAAGQWGGWAPIGAEATANGYEVAWKLAGADQYTVWNTDSNGNDTTNTIGTVSGSSTALESLEPSFHQDLNGNGVIGVVTTVIESFGSTKLAQVGSNYFLDSISTGSGPSLKYGGANIVPGQWGGWAPIGAEATATGYEVAWKLTGADQYTVWNTDSNGNDTTNTIGTVSGSSTALESLEPSFHQDLNGDGVIGIPAAQTASGPASTALVTVANNDTFVFHPGVGADVVANAGSAATIELDGFSSVTSNVQLAALLHEAQAGQSQVLFQSTNDGHDTVINVGNHDSITLMNVHLADLHASNFIIY
jgi:serralysin